jgi:hypothetical protein
MLGYFLTAKIQLSFNNVCSIAIYDLSPTLWKGKNPSLIELLGLLAKEVTEVHFEVVLFVNFFSAQVIGKRTKQVVVSESQV